MSRNPAEIYRANAVYTAPPNVQLAQLHQQAGLWTKAIHDHVKKNEIVDARQKIQYIQDIITFLRSNLDFSFEVSRKAETTYIYFYNMLVDWYIHPSHVVDREEEYATMVEFWDTWTQTWLKVHVK